MAHEATVTSRGRLVIPVGLRRRHHIREGTRVRIEEVQGGLLLRPITDEFIDSLLGIAAIPGMPVDIEREPDMR